MTGHDDYFEDNNLDGAGGDIKENMLPAYYRKKDKSYFCRFTFTQFFTLLVIEIFTLFFVFYLGASFGDELFGSKDSAVAVRSNDLPEFKTTTQTKITTTNDPEINELAKDLMEKAETPDLKERIATLLEKTAEQKKIEKKAMEKKAFLKNRDDVKVFTTQKPKTTTSNKKLTRKPFTIQVGSFPSKDEAKGVVNRWKTRGYEAYYVSADIPGKGLWYRVRLEEFQTKGEASTFLNTFKKRENVDAFIAKN